ncbi:MAG: hypothetical protein NZM36_02080 [Aquificaceae bacterium]|nr:hypothetical protein [Aquificaceae bacterium]
MEKLQIYKKRARQLYFAFLLSTTTLFLACVPLYPYFKVPVHPNLAYFTLGLVFITGITGLTIAYTIRKKSFPVFSAADPYWSYTATRKYFWSYSLCLLPLFIAFLLFIVIARVDALFLGYLMSLCGLILLRPKEEDVQ